jgi:hypothetical protein
MALARKYAARPDRMLRLEMGGNNRWWSGTRR